MLNLHLLKERYELFANKFNLKHDPIVYQCLDKWLIEKSRSNSFIPETVYHSHPVVKYYKNLTKF